MEQTLTSDKKTFAWKITAIHLLVIIIAALVGYSNSLHNDFLMDDHVDLFSPEGAAYKTLETIFIDPQVHIYRPFSHFFCWVAYNAFGADPFPYHVTNLILFMMISVLFYFITLNLTGNQTVAFLTGLLFCIHPINNMLVNYVSAIQICIYLLVTQLAFLFLILSQQNKGRRICYFLSLILYFFCLSSHEMSYFFPLIVVCAAFFLYRLSFKRTITLSLPYFVMAVAYFLFRAIFFEIHSTHEGPGHILPHLGIYLSTYLELILWYLSKLVIPINILFLWASGLEYGILAYNDVIYVAIELGSHRWIVLNYLVLLILALSCVYLIFFRWKKGLKAFLLSVFCLGLVAVGYAGFVYFPITKPIIEPHWFYFTSIGFFIFVAYALINLRSRLPFVVWGLIIALILTGHLISLRIHNTKWKDQETYCRYWISLNKDNLTPYYWLVKTLKERGDYRQMALLIEDGLKGVYTLDERLTAELGYAYIKLGRPEIGYNYLTYSYLVGGIDYAPMHFYFGEYYLQKKDYKNALEAYNFAHKLDPHEIEYFDKLDYAARALDASLPPRENQ